MAELFSSKIKNIEARLNRLKTLGLSSSSSLSVASNDITIPFQIIGTVYSGGHITSAESSKMAYVRIKTNVPAFAAIELVSPLDFGDRIISTERTLENVEDYDYCYRIRIYGTSDDAQYLDEGGSFSPINYTFRFLTTAEAQFNVIMVDTPITT